MSHLDFFIVHGFVGEDVIRSCSNAAKIFVVAEMGHKGAETFMKENAKEIIGRGIYQAKDPQEAARGLRRKGERTYD